MNEEFHLSYLKNTKFEQSMLDYYIGLGSQNRPPYLEDLFSEALQSRALLILERGKDDPFSLCMDSDEWMEVYQSVWENDEYMKYKVLERESPEELEILIREVFSYIHKYRLSLLIRGNSMSSTKSASLFYSPIERVW